MTSPFHGLAIGLSALQTQQRAMEVAGQNMANVDTPGYSRQRVELSPSAAQSTPTLEGFPQLPETGAGVDLLTIRRVRSELLDRQVRNESATLHEGEAFRDGVTRVEGALQDLSGQGLGDALDAFWSGWRELAAAPQEAAARLGVIDRGRQLAQRFNSINDGLAGLQTSLDDQVAGVVGEVNDNATQAADLNRQIRLALVMNQQPNELLDRRDQLVREVVETTGAGVVENDDGTVTVSLGTRALVDGVDAYALTTNPDPGTGLRVIQWSADSTDATISGGELRGLLDVRDSVIPDQLTSLDELAVALRDEVNTVHTGGYDLGGTAGLDFFEGAGAADLAVNSTVADDPDLVAAAETDGGGGGAPGDGENALAMADRADQSLAALSDNTIGGFYRQMVVELGLTIQGADEQVEGQGAVVTFLENQAESVAGVSLDEEAVHLIESQRAYQAAARVITSVDQMLDRLINNTGIVGR
ncbi:MAG: Flagellar hook-associated protein 1 [Anaerolineales bacterium]|nr:Flagellar hook-associated protein 1 [Anaerolineales bacterium]